MKTIVYLGAALIGLSFCNVVSAEMRTWTDLNGKSIEAEYVAVSSGKVILRNPAGHEFKISFNALSKEDQTYTMLQAPPRVEISVSPRIERKNIGGRRNVGPGLQLQTETVRCDVVLKKNSPAIYPGRLSAELYLIGQPERSDSWAILDCTKEVFTFSTENQNQHGFSSSTVSLQQIEAGKQMGLEYRGYLAVVKDQAGTVLSVKCNKLEFEKKADAIIGSSRGDLFDADFKPVDRDKKTRAPRGKRKRPMPGRRF